MNNLHSAKDIFSSEIKINEELDSDYDNNKNVAKLLFKEINQLNKNLKLKHFLSTEKLDPNKLILNSLRIGNFLEDNKKNDNYKHKKRNQIIKESKEKAVTAYLNRKSEKNKTNLNEEFKEILNKYNNNTRIKLDSYFDELIDLKNGQTAMIIDNKKLNLQIESLNNETTVIKQKLSEKDEEINKILDNFKKFDKIRPFFELIKNLPDKDPKKIIYEIFNDKNKLIEYINNLNKANEDYDDIIKLREKEKIKEKEFKDNILEKINKEKANDLKKTQILDHDILNHENQLYIIKNNNIEQIKYKKLLFYLYINIKKYIPENDYNLFIKKLGYNPILSEDNFDPTIFNENLYINLIKDYIINKASKSKEGNLLRITIVFANYLARKYLTKNKEYMRYNPVEAIKNIKLLLDKIKIQNFSLKRKEFILKDQLDELSLDKKNLESYLNEWKKKFKKLLLKIEISKRYQKNKKNQNELKVEENNIIETTNIIKKEKKGKRFSKPKSIEIIDNNNEILFENSDYNKKNQVFITHLNKIYKKNKISYKRILSKENNTQSKNEFKNTDINNNYRNNYLSPKVSLKLKNIFDKLTLSPNKDKLYKKNGIQGYNFYENINKLIKKFIKSESFAKYHYINKRKKLRIETAELSPLLIEKYKNKKLIKNSTEQILRPFSSEISKDNNYRAITHKIYNDIDNIISSMKKIGLTKNNQNTYSK